MSLNQTKGSVRGRGTLVRTVAEPRVAGFRLLFPGGGRRRRAPAVKRFHRALVPLLTVLAMVAGTLSGVVFPQVANADTAGQKIAVPSYIHPGADPQDWNALIDASSSKVGVVIANVLNGPTYQKDQQWADVIHRAHDSGKKVLGYVDTGYLGQSNYGPGYGLPTRLGSTEPADWIAQIEQDVNLWYSFYGTDIDGIFFDEGYNLCGAGTGNEVADWYSFLNQYVKRPHGGSMTVLNPGAMVPQCYENTADVLVTFEGSYSSYYGENPNTALNFADPGWVPSDPDKFWHIIYDVSAAQVADVIFASQARHAGYVYVTDDVLANPYDTIPNSTYWHSEQDNVDGGTITPAPAAALPTGAATPGKPTNVTLSDADYTSAKVQWTAASNATNYFVYVNGLMVAKLPATFGTQVTIGGLVPGGRQYVFYVTAQNGSGLLSTPSSSATTVTGSLPDGQTVTNVDTSGERRFHHVLGGLLDSVRVPAGVHPRRRLLPHRSVLAHDRRCVRAVSDRELDPAGILRRQHRHPVAMGTDRLHPTHNHRKDLFVDRPGHPGQRGGHRHPNERRRFRSSNLRPSGGTGQPQRRLTRRHLRRCRRGRDHRRPHSRDSRGARRRRDRR